MTKFRAKRLSVIDAFQFTEDMANGIVPLPSEVSPDLPGRFRLTRGWGSMPLKVGDWIVDEPDGEAYTAEQISADWDEIPD